MKRFYPRYVPEFPHEPTPESFQIAMISREVGRGLVSRKFFSVGDIVFGFTGFVLDFITQYTLRTPEGKHIHDPFVMGKVLHSCDPNMSCDMFHRRFIARKEIIPGDLITMDYDQTESILYRPFTCRCGHANCRNRIEGSQKKQKSEVYQNF